MDKSGLYFRMGKSTKETLQVFDKGGFHDAPFNVAPYTHVLLDTKLEVCAIAKNSKLSVDVDTVAANLVRVLKAKSSSQFRDSMLDFEISPISDPKDFLYHLKAAYAILSYRVEFSRPNPLDADEDFHKPLQRLLKATRGQKGLTEVKGDALDEGTLERLTRSAVAAGNNAHAKLRMSGDSPVSVRKSTTTNPVILTTEGEPDEAQLAILLNDIRSKYEDVRNGKRHDGEK
jgi:hypothetical protein